ncbi:MAG: hypothetical protein Q9168_006790 [Polycauliona sp. 1 TL-2023]
MTIFLNLPRAGILLLFLSHFLSLVSPLALPAGPQDSAISLVQLNAIHKVSDTITETVGQNVANLFNNIAHYVGPQWKHPQIKGIRLQVDKQGTRSTNIKAFRLLDCLVHFTDTTRNPPARILYHFENRWPSQWDQWQAPVQIPNSERRLSFDWQRLFLHMSVEWADWVLKTKGYRGAYEQVTATQSRDRPGHAVGWCFEGFDDPVGVFNSVLVDVNGHVEIVQCNDG